MPLHGLQVQEIDVIKDLNLSNGDGKDDPDLANLELFHLVGPFGPDVTKYILKGAKNLKNLALVINWLETCSVQPTGDKDYIGIEYLKEVLKVNPLDTNLEQLHLSAIDKKNRHKLDKECAAFVLNTFGARLKHLGNFSNWNLKRDDRNSLVAEIVAQNRSLVVDENLKINKLFGSGGNGGDKIDFHKKFVENRMSFSCQDPQTLVFDQYDEGRNNNNFVADVISMFDVLAGLHGFLDGNGGLDEASDSDDSIMESDDGDDVFAEDDDEEMNLWLNE